jgi:hypothetical protein
MKIIIFVIIVHIVFIFITRWLNHLTVKYNNDDRLVIMWFIPLMNIVASVAMLVTLIGHWYKHGNKSRLTRWFLGENWKPYVIDPNDEAKLNNMDIRTIEQYLRKKKLKNLK